MPLMESLKATQIKTVMVGDAAVGKTSILARYTTGTFSPEVKPTIGAGCVEKCLIYNGAEYLLEIWDTAGQEDYRSLVPMYYHGARIIIIVADLTDSKTTTKVKSWVDEIKERVGDSVVLALCGNKSDLIGERQMTLDEMQDIAAENDLLYFETSALSGIGIDEMFQTALSKMTVQKVPEENRLTEKTDENKSKCC